MDSGLNYSHFGCPNVSSSSKNKILWPPNEWTDEWTTTTLPVRGIPKTRSSTVGVVDGWLAGCLVSVIVIAYRTHYTIKYIWETLTHWHSDHDWLIRVYRERDRTVCHDADDDDVVHTAYLLHPLPGDSNRTKCRLLLKRALSSSSCVTMNPPPSPAHNHPHPLRPAAPVRCTLSWWPTFQLGYISHNRWYCPKYATVGGCPNFLCNTH